MEYLYVHLIDVLFIWILTSASIVLNVQWLEVNGNQTAVPQCCTLKIAGLIITTYVTASVEMS